MIGATVVRQEFADVTDIDVINRVHGGETHLFEILMRRYNRTVFRVARAILCDDALAEDAVQEAYLKAFSQLRQYSHTAAFSTWLTRIGINEALQRKRSLGRLIYVDDAALLEGRDTNTMEPSTPHGALEAKELKAVLEQSLDRLPEPYRLVIMLRDIEGFSTADAAQLLACSEPQIKVRLHRARRALRKDLEQQFDSIREELFAFAGERCDRIVDAVLHRLETRSS